MQKADPLPGRPRPRVARLLAKAGVFGALVVLLGVSGCSSTTNEAANSVSGKVTLSGQAVHGKVTFHGADKSAEAPTNPDGSYKIDNPPQGSVRITVSALPGTVVGGPPPKDVPPMPGGSLGIPPPAKYANASSGLTYEVKAGKQTHDIPLSP